MCIRDRIWMIMFIKCMVTFDLSSDRDMMVTSMVFRNKRHNCPVSRLPYGYRHNGRLTMVVPVTILWQLIMDTTVVSLVS